MHQRSHLRRLAAVALAAGVLGVLAQAPAASASRINLARSATASPAPAPAPRSAAGPARTTGFCWNKPILPDWCQFDTVRERSSAASRGQGRRAADNCATIERRIEWVRNAMDNLAWEPGDPGGKLGYLAKLRRLTAALRVLHQEKCRCERAAQVA